MYSATTATFLQRDPFPRDGSLSVGYSHEEVTMRVRNLYEYVDSKPTVATDPTGMVPFFWVLDPWNKPKPKNQKVELSLCIKSISKNAAQGSGQTASIAIANVAGHAYLAIGPDPMGGAIGYGLMGTEQKGNPPYREFPGGAWDPPHECFSCYVQLEKGKRLAAGKAQGKLASQATTDELEDCIASIPAKKNYSVSNYNCFHWSYQAAAECGLTCEPPLEKPAGMSTLM